LRCELPAVADAPSIAVDRPAFDGPDDVGQVVDRHDEPGQGLDAHAALFRSYKRAQAFEHRPGRGRPYLKVP
jgi:hypothetical protein